MLSRLLIIWAGFDSLRAGSKSAKSTSVLFAKWLALAMVIASLASPQRLRAATLFWDADGAGAACGGTGNWETTTALWSLTSCTGPYQAWNNANGDSASLGGTTAAATVTLTTGITVNKLFVTSQLYTVGGGSTLTFSGTDAGIDFNIATTPAVSNDRLTISCPTTGVLLKTGNGRVIWNNATTTVSKYILRGGFLTSAAINRFGTAPGSLVADFLTLDGGGWGIDTGSQDLGTTRGITLGPGGGFLGGISAATLIQTISGPITGSGPLTITTGTPFYTPINALGVVVLSSTANAYAGPTVVSGGTLRLGAAGVIPDSSALTISGGGLDLATLSETVGVVTITSGSITNGTLIGSDYQLQGGTIGGVLGGSAGVTKTGSGTATLSGANTFTGKTTVLAGQLTINAAGGNETALGAAPASPVTDQLTLDGGAFSIGTAAAVTLNANRGIRLGASGGTISLTSGSTILTIPGNISGPGGLTKSGPNNLTLSGSNTFAGDFAISGGGIRFNSDLAAGLGRIIVTPASIITLRNLAPTITSTVTNPITLNANGGFDIDLTAAAGNTFTLSGPISGPGYMTRGRATGASGTVVLSGDNSAWSGGLYLQRGIIGLGHKNALGSAPFQITPQTNASPEAVSVQATVALTGASAIPTTVIINTNFTMGGTMDLEFAGPIIISNTTRTVIVTNNSVFSGVLSSDAGAGLVKAGAGTLTLAAANTYTGNTTVDAGTLRVANLAGSATGTGTVTVNSGGRLAGSGTIAGAVVVNGTISPGN